MNSSIMSFFSTALGQQQKCCLQPCCGNMAGWIIDYESENIYMLTNESLQQICGANMFFSHVSCGYGLFPPAKIQTLSPKIKNWGKDDYNDNKSTIRKFFNKKENRHYGVLMISTKGSVSIDCHYRCIRLGNITVL
jgi:hypothetical protein